LFCLRIGAEICIRQSFEKEQHMKATETLEHEHRVIEEVASACGVCAEVLRGGTKVPIDVLESIVDFFRKYGNRYHRQAEEALLSVLHDKGVPTAACPIVVINYENQKRQTLVDQLTSAVNAYVESGGAVRETLASTLQALAEFFPDHIWKEEYLLLPMAEKVLSEEDKNSLADSLNLIDSMKGAEARHAVERFSGAIHRCMDNVAPPKQVDMA
jgi:hemerythrin-like domain-containing protein